LPDDDLPSAISYLNYFSRYTSFPWSTKLPPEIPLLPNSLLESPRHHHPRPEPFSHPFQPLLDVQALAVQTQAVAPFQIPRTQDSLVFDNHSLLDGEDNTALDYYHVFPQDEQDFAAINFDFELANYGDSRQLDFENVTALSVPPQLLEPILWPLFGTTPISSVPSLADSEILRPSPTSMGTTLETSSSERLGAYPRVDFATSWSQPLYV
jgi:hypothetical protein